MLFLRKVPSGDALTRKAERLGVSLNELHDQNGVRREPELQRRVLDAARARRESWLWLVALIAAVVSLVAVMEARRANTRAAQSARESVTVAQEALAEARKANQQAADAAQRALVLTRQSLEARLVVREVKIGPVPSLRVGAIGSILVAIENAGKVPAEHLRVASQAYLLKTDEAVPTPPRSSASGGDIGPGITQSVLITMASALSASDLADIRNRTRVLVFVGLVHYSDQFAVEKPPLSFCLQWSPPSADEPGSMVQCLGYRRRQ
jgi:hypothetical protein